MTPIGVPYHSHPAGDGTHVVFIPHAATIVQTALLIALLAILLWREHVRFVKACTCQKDRGTFLKPKWKKVEPKDDYDRYDDDA